MQACVLVLSDTYGSLVDKQCESQGMQGALQGNILHSSVKVGKRSTNICVINGWAVQLSAFYGLLSLVTCLFCES